MIRLEMYPLIRYRKVMAYRVLFTEDREDYFKKSMNQSRRWSRRIVFAEKPFYGKYFGHEFGLIR